MAENEAAATDLPAIEIDSSPRPSPGPLGKILMQAETDEAVEVTAEESNHDPAYEVLDLPNVFSLVVNVLSLVTASMGIVSNL